jgi:hypothetical protein
MLGLFTHVYHIENYFYCLAISVNFYQPTIEEYFTKQLS